MLFTAACTVSTGVFLIFSVIIFDIEAIKALGGAVLSVLVLVSVTERGGVHKQMLPTDLRKDGVGARCSNDPSTLVPADVAVMEMSAGSRN